MVCYDWLLKCLWGKRVFGLIFVMGLVVVGVFVVVEEFIWINLLDFKLRFG